VTRLAIGSVSGIVLSGWLFFVASLYVPLSPAHGRAHGTVLAAAALVLRRARGRAPSPPAPFSRATAVLAIFAPVLCLCLLFHLGMLYEGNIARGACDGYLPFHLNLISSFAYGCNSRRRWLFDLASPFLAREPLAYPVIPNFYSAVLLQCFGASFHACLVLLSIVAALAMLIVLARITHEFCGDAATCCLAGPPFLLSGGLGFVRFLDPAIRGEFYVDFIHFWGRGRYEYWLQTVIHILMPQRASLFSLPLTWAVVLMLGAAPLSVDRRWFAAIGVIVARLPQVQPHSVVATSQYGAVLALLPWPRGGVAVVANYAVLAAVAAIGGAWQLAPFLRRVAPEFLHIRPL
jgi:lipoprotein signal peptidase